jgi:hypothetical protein
LNRPSRREDAEQLPDDFNANRLRVVLALNVRILPNAGWLDLASPEIHSTIVGLGSARDGPA